MANSPPVVACSWRVFITLYFNKEIDSTSEDSNPSLTFY
jgi:hypothetical protein